MERLLVFVVLAPVLLAQNYGVIEGTVTDSNSQAGIPNVSVQVRAVDGRSAGYVGKTDSSGQFRIERVMPGDYSASYLGANYAPPDFSQGAYKPFHVAAGGDPSRIRVQLAPLGRFSARVVDEDGNPVARAQLLLVRLRGNGGSAGYTDPQGALTLCFLPAGDYVLLARPVLAGTLLGEKEEARTKLPEHPREGERYQWMSTYFPNALDRSEAETIRIRAGSDLSGYVIRLRTAQVFTVDGVVSDGEGVPVPKALLTLAAPDALIAGVETRVAADAEGHFEFPAVPSGTWSIAAEGSRNHLILKGAGTVTVSARNVADLSVHLAAPFTLTGTVERQEQTTSTTQSPRFGSGVQLFNSHWEAIPTANAVQDQDGNFQLKDIYPGRYRIVPVGAMPGYYVDSVTMGGSNVLGQEVDLAAGSQPIRIVYRANPARLRGTVEDGGGSTVFLVPQEEGLLSTSFIRSILCDGSGRFEMGNLRPGDYYAFAFDHADIVALTDASFVRALVSQAAPVHVDAGEIGSVNLRVTGWPE